MATFIYKPETYKGPVVLVPDEGTRTPPTITTSDGKTFTGRYLNTNEGRHQFVFPPEIIGYSGLNLTYDGAKTTLGSGAQSYESASVAGLANSPRAKGSIGSGSMGMSGVPGQYQPGMVGGFGVVPANILAEFPEAKLAKYKNLKNNFSIDAAKYNFTDPFEFASKYGEYGRGEYKKNFDMSKDMALESLQTELKGLQEFAPAAAALKRQETSLDNQFNQAERTKQLTTALGSDFIPGVNADLEGQRGRAGAYAEGRIPDAVSDRAFELGIRSSAADRAAAGGFGARSSVARKASDLLSASERVKLSQYGDQLLTSNVGSRLNFANFQLAPIEYSNAGNQINVMPSQSASQLTKGFADYMGSQYGLSAGQAFAGQMQQEQYQTNLEQETNKFNTVNKINVGMFNTGNQLQTDMFNVTNQNNFALSKFGYKAGYANSVASAGQTSVNTQFGLDQQNMYQDLMKQYMNKSQDAGTLESILSGGMSLAPTVLSAFTGGKGGGGKGGGSVESNSLGGGLAAATEGIADAASGIFEGTIGSIGK